MPLARKLAALAIPAILFTATPSLARITRLEIVRVEPAFGERSFGPAGSYERVIGRAYGEVDPKAPASAAIQDVQLAPANARGMVEYVTDIDILRPADPARANGVLLFNILNRGNKGALNLFNADVRGNAAAVNAVADPGDGWLQRQGYTLVWFGWQADVLPGDGRMTLTVPAARNPDGSPVTGIVRSELMVRAPTTTLNLSSGWFTATTHSSYPTVSTDNQSPLPRWVPAHPHRSPAGERTPRADLQQRVEFCVLLHRTVGGAGPHADLLPGRVPARPTL